MILRQVARKFLAVAALMGLLVATVPALAESLSASSSPPCCNTIYCPVHHRQPHQLQKDKSVCDSQGNSAGNDCSMRACDTAPNPVVGTSPFVLMAPLAMRGSCERRARPNSDAPILSFHRKYSVNPASPHASKLNL